MASSNSSNAASGSGSVSGAHKRPEEGATRMSSVTYPSLLKMTKIPRLGAKKFKEKHVGAEGQTVPESGDGGGAAADTGGLHAGGAGDGGDGPQGVRAHGGVRAVLQGIEYLLTQESGIPEPDMT